MLATAKSHFGEDIARARGLLAHARGVPAGVVRNDVLRASWMMAVGALDAYFSDAYADLIARTLRAKDLQPAIAIPDRLNNLRIPVTAVLRQSHGGWRWRMAARELIEDENVLSLEKVRGLFNHFLRRGHKIINQDTVESWILHPRAKQRLFGVTGTGYRARTAVQQGQARKDAVERLEERFQMIFQRRHDCIHNCDRPKVALQLISDSAVVKIILDVEFLVERCQDAFLAEFSTYLRTLGFSGATRNQVTQ